MITMLKRSFTNRTDRAAAPGRLAIHLALAALIVLPGGLASRGAESAPEATAPAQRPSARGDSRDGEGWAPLFNGRDLGGWVQRGGKAQYRVEDGAILGRTVPSTPNSFLCTTRDFKNFVLELEFKVDPKMNSGIQFRSQVFDKPTTVEYKGRKITVPGGRVHGYQYEIDPSSRQWTGGIYDEGRRGWLQSLKENPAARQAFLQNEWNRCRIEARGDSLRTWINGVPAADVKDGLTPSGFIALQVHGIGRRTDAMEVRWRNIRLKELPDGDTPTPGQAGAKQ
jgi:hypothetical protein